VTTRATQIAVLEAQRNERLVLAEGSLKGELRVSTARVVMVVIFALVTELGPKLTGAGPSHPLERAVGASYMATALLFAVGIRRVRQASPGRSTVMPIVTTLLDFSFVTTLALIEAPGSVFDRGMHAITCAILISFSVARSSLWHTVFSLAIAVVSFTIATVHAGIFATRETFFTLGGFAVLAFLVGMTNRAVRVMFQDLRARDNLTRFLPQVVAERMLKLGPAALAPVQREVTVLFSDIRGFTTMAEGLEPRAVLALLDDYFGRMSQIVKGHDGVVGKFLGDGMLAFWGVPDRAPDHALRAVKAALDMRRGLVELNREREADGEAPIRIGIGIHTGTVAAGTLGGALQTEYTVIGDAVNVASRIEGLTKTHEVDVLVSETTWQQLDGAVKGEKLVTETIRGRKEPVVLYTIRPS
jgi:adenylate cyclase